MGQFLYRGVSGEIHDNKRSLCPKGVDFYQACKYGERKYGEGTYGKSERNAVIRHQDDTIRYPTSGVSTTPHFERAKYYALGNGRNQRGYVYKIDRNKLNGNQVKEYIVKNYAPIVKIPEDDEVILVSDDNLSLPENIICEIIELSE